MDTSRSLPADPLPAAQPLHDPSAADISRIADTLMRDAVAAAPGTVPPLPAEAPMAPPPVASPLPVHAPAAIPAIPSSAAAPFVPAALPVALPSTAPAFSSPLAVSPSVASPATDYSGLKAFVGRIRGLDHLDLPRVFDGGTQPLAHPSAATAAPTISSPSAFFDIDAVRRDFPILQEKVHGKPLAWFDNAATTQKPQAVIDAISHFYAHDNSNIHRGAHTLAARATDAYEASRTTVANFLGANGSDEIVFVRGCTEGINLVANILAPGLSRGDEILLTPTSSPGRWWPRAPAPCSAWPRSTTAAT